VVLRRDGDRLFLAPIAAATPAAGPLDLDTPETDQHEALCIRCSAGGWITLVDSARLDLVASIDDRQLCEARRRVMLRFSAFERPGPAGGAERLGAAAPARVGDPPAMPAPAVSAAPSAGADLPARAPMGIAMDAEPGPLGLWVAAQLDADRSLGVLSARWAGTSVGRELLAAARARSGGADREPALLDGIFDGVESALSRIVASPGVSFDDAWVVYEALEETAQVVAAGTPSLGDRFAARVAAAVASIASPIVAGGLTWGVNELLERGPSSAALAIRVARALLADPLPLVCDVMYTLTTLRRPLADALAASGHSEVLAARAIAARAYLSEADAAVTGLDASLALAGDAPLDLGALLAPLAPLLAKIHAGARAPAEGILAMAAIKRPLACLCRAIGDRPDREALVTGVCDAFLAPLAERGACSAFLVVEALEVVRDVYPEETAAMMADRLVRVQPDVACGLGVCIAEGIEKELGADPARRPPRFTVHDDPGSARRCEFEDGAPPSAFGDFGRRSLHAAEAHEDIAGVWKWCAARLRGY
jgi:hypothetical protein